MRIVSPEFSVVSPEFTSSVSGDLPGLGNGIAGYHAIALDGQLLSKAGNYFIKGAGYFTGFYGVYNDLQNISKETSECRAGGGL
jgi:hypothetical protein